MVYSLYPHVAFDKSIVASSWYFIQIELWESPVKFFKMTPRSYAKDHERRRDIISKRVTANA